MANPFMSTCPKCGNAIEHSEAAYQPGAMLHCGSCGNEFHPARDARGDSAVQVGTGAVRANLYPPGAKFPARYDLLFRNGAGLRRLAETYGEGVAKYGPDNWMNGFPESVMVSHALEHFRLFMSGDTSEDHLAHAAWNILTLMWIQENKPELMDLTKPAQKA